MFQVRNILFAEQTNSFFLSLGQGVYIFEETPKSIQEVIGDVYCPGKYCLKKEKCESIGGYVTTRRSKDGCGKCRALLFVHEVPSTLQDPKRRQRQTKQAFSLLKKMNLVRNKQLFLNDPFQSTKYRKDELCVDNNLRDTIGDVYSPTSRNEKCVYISTKKMTSFYNCKSAKPAVKF